MQDYNHKARRGTNAFTFTELRIVHVFTVGCLTFAQILLPLQTVNDFLWHHHHWMEWFRPTIEINGFSMVLGSGNHWKRWFSMVFHHWSNDGMVTYHRWSLVHSDEEKSPDQHSKRWWKWPSQWQDLYRLVTFEKFWQLRNWINDDVCSLTNKSETGQHSQFLRCFSLLTPKFHHLSTLSSNYSLDQESRPLNPLMLYIFIIVRGSACSWWDLV